MRILAPIGATVVMAAMIALASPAPPAQAKPKGCSSRSAPSGTPAWAARHRMTMLVDSVLLSARPGIRSTMPCWHIHLRGRPALMLRIAERELRASRQRVSPLVVIGLGYNSLWERNGKRNGYWSARFDREAKKLLWILRRRGARQFVWVTLRQPTASTVPAGARGELATYAWYFPYVNARLRALDAQRDDLVLADWTAASNRPGVTYDTIHVNAAGGKLMGRTIKAAIRKEALRQMGL